MHRVLFVVKEADDLAELQQSLRAFRRYWEMSFCSHASVALDLFEQNPFDVVLTELSLDKTTGAELLEKIRELYPDAIRMMFCNQAEHGELFRAVGPAHQYLSKPCDPELLFDSVARAQLVNRRITTPGLKTLVTKTDSLPSLPAIYLQLIEELRDPDASVDRVGQLISQDLGMTAKVLQLVNSPFFGLPVHVKDACHAAALLGLNTLRPLVLTAGVFRELETSSISPSLLEGVLDHSLAVGWLARRLGETEGLDRDAADDTMLAGILHDVGKLVLADELGRDYTLVAAAAEQTQLPLSLAELDQFDTSHADVGGYLAALWGLPATIVEAITFHHDPGDHPANHFTPLAAVYVANALWHSQNPPAHSPVATHARLDRSYLARIGCEDKIEHWQEIALQRSGLATA